MASKRKRSDIVIGSNATFEDAGMRVWAALRRENEKNGKKLTKPVRGPGYDMPQTIMARILDELDDMKVDWDVVEQEAVMLMSGTVVEKK